MERVRNSRHGVNEATDIIDGDGWEAWEAIPRDGPAVFIVDTVALSQGVVRGRWVSVADADGGMNLHAELTALLGHEPEEGSWAVVDQVGLGGVMAPETLSVVDLAAVAEDLRTRSLG